MNGGTAQVAIAEAAALQARGHRVSFMAGVGPVDTRLTEAGVHVHLTGQQEIAVDRNPFRAALHGFRNGQAERAMKEQLEGLSAKQTVVHLHGWTKCLSASVIRPAVDAGFPVLVHLHDYFSVCPNGGLYNFQTNLSCSLKPMSAACLLSHCDKKSYAHKLYRVARQTIQNRLNGIPSRTRYFAAVSLFSRKIMGPYLPIEATIFDLPNPVDIERQLPARPLDSETFVWVGRLSPEKGTMLFARAAARAGASALFVGDGPQRDEIARGYAGAAITGWLEPLQVQQMIRKSRALVYSPVCYETQGLAVLEAAALGVPAIVSDGCAAREAVVDNVTGLLFKSGDEEDLADKIRHLATGDQAAEMGRQAYDRYWTEPPTMAAHIEKLESVYRAILNRESAALDRPAVSEVTASISGMSE
ncbi:MAG: glycosyltransferase family 4 protein [Candidatus Zixiibacteriota bacterium]